MADNEKAIAIGVGAVGAAFAYSALKGKSFLSTVQNVIRGNPASKASPLPTGNLAPVSGITPVTNVPSSNSANVEIVRRHARKYGWDTGPEWNALVDVINRESGFNNNAQNPTSTAYGIFQFLDSTWGIGGISKTSNPTLQTEAGLLYIKQRYGDPIGAEAHEQAYGWY